MKNKMISWILICAVIVGSLGVAVFFYLKYQNISGNVADREAKEAVAKVGKIMVLPDELPSVATVTDKSKLSSQKFFKNAENGDKVLIYALASKAILYRPASNKIIEVASVLPSSSNLTPVPTAAVVAGSPKVVLYNGTSTLGLTTKIESKINDKKIAVEVVGKETAVRSDYQQTIVVDLNGGLSDKLTDLVNLLGAKLVKLPAGELKPDADVVVILGKDAI